MKKKLITLFTLAAIASSANAATVAINNVVAGPGDYLYASNNVPLTGAIVTLGTFTTGFSVASNLGDIPLLIANFEPLTSGLTGNFSDSLGGSFAGYAEYAPFNIGNITGADALLGKNLYSFVGDLATLASSTAYALLDMGVLADDFPVPNDYSANPGAAISTLIGSYDTVNGDFGGGPGTYNTLNLVPEPSAVLLGALGALGLLRRRRI